MSALQQIVKLAGKLPNWKAVVDEQERERLRESKREYNRQQKRARRKAMREGS